MNPKAQLRLELLKIAFHWSKEPKHIVEVCEAIEGYVLEVMDPEDLPAPTNTTTRGRKPA